MGYFVIALVVAPKIRMTTASSRTLLVIRTAAIVFFLGCGMTHVHILLHTLGFNGAAQPIEPHEIVFHMAQAVGSWLFILGAALKLELHVVPSERTAKQRDLARAELAAQREVTATSQLRAARSSALALISGQALAQANPAHFTDAVAGVVREVLDDRFPVAVAQHEVTQPTEFGDRHFFTVEGPTDLGDEDREFITSVNSLLLNAQRRLQVEAELRHRSLHDPLTGLPNRVLLMDRLEQALAKELRSAEPVSVLFIDLDGFKQINDTLGHEAGDRLLVEVAARLGAVARPEDTIARQSGDEFVLVCERTDTETAVKIARRVTTGLGRPYVLPEGIVTVTASVGVATSDGTCDAEEVLHCADAAMYRAKELGSGGVHRFDDSEHGEPARTATSGAGRAEGGGAGRQRRGDPRFRRQLPRQSRVQLRVCGYRPDPPGDH